MDPLDPPMDLKQRILKYVGLVGYVDKSDVFQNSVLVKDRNRGV